MMDMPAATPAAVLRGLAHGVLLQTASGALLASAAAVAIALFAALRAAWAWAWARLFVVFEFPEDTMEYKWVTAWLSERPEARASGIKQLASAGGGADDESEDDEAANENDDDAPPASDERVMLLRAAGGDTLCLRTRLVQGAPLTVRLEGGVRMRVSREAPPPPPADAQSSRSSYDSPPDPPPAVLRIRLARRGAEAAMLRVLLESRRTYDAQHKTRMLMYEPKLYERYGGMWMWDRTEPAPRAVALSEVVFPPGSAEPAALLADMTRFMDSERWYSSRGIPYHRGVLLHGPGGSGKTMLAHALATALDLAVFAVDLSMPKLTDDALANLFRIVRTRSIILVDRIDKTFDKKRARRTSAKGAAAGLTFSGVLTVLDGVSAANGCVVVFTSELPPAELDSALVRDGRVDCVVAMAAADAVAAAALFRAFFAQHPFYASEAGQLDAAAASFRAALAGRAPGAFSHRDVLSYLGTRSPAQAVSEVAALGLDAAALAARALQGITSA